MYDKCKLWVPRTANTPDVEKHLEAVKENIDKETGEVCTYGTLYGLKVSIYTGNIAVEGSLPRVIYPNNIYPLDRHGTAQAIEKLSDTLHLPMNEAKVTGLEFGKFFPMKHPVECYFSRLGNMSRYRREAIAKGSLYYKQKNKELVFYDKKADAKAKGMTIPLGFEDANLLKIEMRFLRYLSNQTGVSNITGVTLSDTAFYRHMIKMYQDMYYSITKLKQGNMEDLSNIKTPDDGFRLLISELLNETDPQRITDFLSRLKEVKAYRDNKSYSRLKRKIQEVMEIASATKVDELIEELNDDIKHVGAYV